MVIQSGHLEGIRGLAYSPDVCFLATAGGDNRAKLWDETIGLEVRSFRGGESPHGSVAFMPDGRSLMIGVEHGSVTRGRWMAMSQTAATRGTSAPASP